MDHPSRSRNTPLASLSADHRLSRFAAPKHVITVCRGETTVLVDARQGEYFTLNDVGSRIWALAVERVPLVDIGATLSLEYDVQPDDAVRDAGRVVGDLLAAGLLIPSDVDDGGVS